MPTSSMPKLLSEVLDSDPGKPIPLEVIAYFCRKVRRDFHREVVSKWSRLETMRQKDLADRLGKEPAVISRLLSAPGNWELDTVTMLLLAMRALPRLEIDNIQELVSNDNSSARINTLTNDQLSRPTSGGSNRIAEMEPKGLKSEDFVKRIGVK
jgi:hypothetical protein